MITCEAMLVRRGAFSLAIDAGFATPALGLIGHSGCGKSTFVQTLVGMHRLQAGRLSLRGRLLADATDGTHLPIHKRRLGVVFQDGLLLPHYRVLGNLRYGMPRRPDAASRRRLDEVVELLELAPLLQRRVTACSGGERRRVAIARALCCMPDLLVLDEPCTGLDALLKRQLLPYIARLQRELGVPLLHISHDLDELSATCADFAVLAGGRLVARGSADTIMADPACGLLLRAMRGDRAVA